MHRFLNVAGRQPVSVFILYYYLNCIKMAMTKRQKATNARKNAEALKAQRKQVRDARSKASATAVATKGKKGGSGIKKSAKKK